MQVHIGNPTYDKQNLGPEYAILDPRYTGVLKDVVPVNSMAEQGETQNANSHVFQTKNVSVYLDSSEIHSNKPSLLSRKDSGIHSVMNDVTMSRDPTNERSGNGCHPYLVLDEPDIVHGLPSGLSSVFSLGRSFSGDDNEGFDVPDYESLPGDLLECALDSSDAIPEFNADIKSSTAKDSPMKTFDSQQALGSIDMFLGSESANTSHDMTHAQDYELARASASFYEPLVDSSMANPRPSTSNIPEFSRPST